MNELPDLTDEQKEELRQKLYATGPEKDFVHLHLHSDFSLKDAVGKPDQYIKKASSLGMRAIAITDHGNIGCHPGFFQVCKSYGIKPIPGCEIYGQDRRADVAALDARVKEYDEPIKSVKALLKVKKITQRVFDGHKVEILRALGVEDIDLETLESMDVHEVRQKFAALLDQLVEEKELIAAERNSLKKNYHLILLPKNEQGRRNITRIVTDANRNGFYYKPRTSFDFFSKYCTDMIVTSACLAGPINKVLFKNLDDQEKAIEAAKEEILKYRAVLGDNFFVEIQMIDLEQQRVMNPMLIEAAKRAGCAHQIIVTNDAHYVNDGGGKAREVSMMLGSKDETGEQLTMRDKRRFRCIREIMDALGTEDKDLERAQRIYNDFIDLERFKEFKPAPDVKAPIMFNEIKQILLGETKLKKIWEFSTKDLWFKNRHQIIDAYIEFGYYKIVSPEDLVVALDNTLRVADQVTEWEWDSKEKLPKIELNDGETAYDKLVTMVREGWDRKAYDSWYEDDSEYIKRVKYELGVIRKLDLADYFIIVSDYIRWAKNNEVLVGAGRGSAAGSLVCFLLDITNLDPIEHDLIFERFLSLSRSIAIYDLGVKDFAAGDSDVDFQPTPELEEWFKNGRIIKMEE